MTESQDRILFRDIFNLFGKMKAADTSEDWAACTDEALRIIDEMEQAPFAGDLLRAIFSEVSRRKAEPETIKNA